MTPGPGADRAALFERPCRPEPGRTALLLASHPHATLDIVEAW